MSITAWKFEVKNHLTRLSYVKWLTEKEAASNAIKAKKYDKLVKWVKEQALKCKKDLCVQCRESAEELLN